MEKILLWIIKKFFGNKFILRDQISNALVEAKQNEAKRLRQIYQENQDQVIEKIELDKQIEIDELKAQIIILENEMCEYRLKLKEAKQVYFKTVERAKVNDEITREIGKDADKLCGMIASVTGIISGIRDKSSQHIQEIKAEEKKDLKKLGIQ